MKVILMRYKATFHLKSPVIFYEPLFFDSLLLYCYIKDKIGFVPSNMSIDEPIEFDLLNHHSSGVYMASVMQYEENFITDITNFTKHWHKSHQYLVGNKKTFKINQGAYKSYNLPYETKNIDKCWFVFETENIEDVKRILNTYCFSLGKKRNRGFGAIEKIEFEETTDGIFRPIPCESNPDIYIPLNPPYWEVKNCVGCKFEGI